MRRNGVRFVLEISFDRSRTDTSLSAGGTATMRAMLRTATYTVTLVALAVIVTAAAPEVSRRLFQVPHFRPQGLGIT